MNLLKKLFVGVGIATTFGITAAQAALPAAVGTAITAAQADGTDLGYQMLGLAVAVGVIFWLKRKV